MYTTTVVLLLSLLCHVCHCTSHTDAGLTDDYQFRQQLHERYVMYWSFDSEMKTVSFAVRVQTTGWIGFGLSPNGQMPGSDVIIGWVDDNGDAFFNDRFAEARSTPSIDESQDWSLVGAEEDDDYTVLEFKRNYYSCDDDNDLNIEEGTSRIVWSFKEEDPRNGADGRFERHDFQGSRSLNLRGGLIDPPADPPGTESFAIEVNNVPIPAVDTTYWCSSFSLEDIIPSFNEQKYIIRISPEISEGSAPYVHHLLVYGCEYDLSEVDAHGSVCGTNNETDACLSGVILGAWAVGGEDFIFPEHVAFPIGGPNSIAKYVVIEMHYDNPNLDQGVIDSSGLRFYYTTTPRRNDAGLLQIGHIVTPLMIIPPGAEQYTIFGYCAMDCSETLPEDGVRVFANFLHTHLLGIGLEVMHFRRNDSCDGGFEELQPIDRNLRYDFNYQNGVYFDKEMTILPGDVLLLKCIYDSTGQDGVTLGGLGTRNEMCLSFLYYYPLSALTTCLSQPIIDFNQLILNYVPASQQHIFADPEVDPSFGNRNFSVEAFEGALNQLDWTEDQINGLQSASRDAQLNFWLCLLNDDANPLIHNTNPLLDPSTSCPYVDPIELECTTDGASTISATIVLLLLSVVMSIMMLSSQ